MKQNIGLSIKKARKLRNINQEKLAKKIGITTESLSRIETEKINPSIETLTKISKTLGIPIAFILTLGLEEKSFPRRIRVRYNLTKKTISSIVQEMFKV